MKPTHETVTLSMAYEISVQEAAILIDIYNGTIKIAARKIAIENDNLIAAKPFKLFKSTKDLQPLIDAKAIEEIDHVLKSYGMRDITAYYKLTQGARQVIAAVLAGEPVAVGGDGCAVKAGGTYVYLFFIQYGRGVQIDAPTQITVEEMDGTHAIDSTPRSYEARYLYADAQSALADAQRKLANFINSKSVTFLTLWKLPQNCTSNTTPSKQPQLSKSGNS